MRTRLRWLGLGVAAAVMLSASAAFGYAKLFGSNGTLTACAKTQNGQLRLVHDGESCGPSEERVQWNIQGPQGPQGPPGTSGGSSAFTIRHNTVQRADGGYDAIYVTATCLAGEHAVSGGGWGHSDTYDADGYLSGLRPTDSGDGWEAIFFPAPGGFEATAYVVCASG